MFAAVADQLRAAEAQPQDLAAWRRWGLLAGPDNLPMEQEETYVCTDIEADGPIPGPNSMISLASAAFNSEGRLLDTFAANLLPLPGAAPNPQTMEWWEGNPEA